jgi:phage gp46-like protein
VQDVQIKPNEDGLFDLVIDGADFAGVDGLETAIANSLFSDRRADAARVQNPKNRRGWVGDIFTASDGRKIGSQLWTLDQARLTPQTVNDARVFAIEALQWMIEDRVARSVDVIVDRRGARELAIAVTFTTPAGDVRQYDYIWRNTSVSNISNR